MTDYRYKKVDSSNISSIAYDAGDPLLHTGTLRIRFNSGQEYEYADFPERMAEEFFESESKGSFFHKNIRGSYKGVKQEEVSEEPTETRFDRQRDGEREATGKLESEEVDRSSLRVEAEGEKF